MTSVDTIPLVAVVDDDRSVRSSVSRLIRAFGYEVEAHESADAYLKADHDRPPDCLVLDVHMPGLSGFELKQRLRETGDRTAVIFITAHADSATREKAMNGGAIELLSKPFSDEDLHTSLQRGILETQKFRN